MTSQREAPGGTSHRGPEDHALTNAYPQHNTAAASPAPGGVNDQEGAFHAVFNGGRGCIAIQDIIYMWAGTHYEPESKEQSQQRIQNWFIQSFKSIDPAATNTRTRTSLLNDTWRWCLTRLQVVDPDTKIDPPGHLNCTNGVLRLRVVGRQLVVEFLPHSPELIFLEAPTWAYDPQAPEEDCLRMLEALDPEDRQEYLNWAACGLALRDVRRVCGRVPAVMAVGEGSNGKDVLFESQREVVGHRATSSCSFADFVSHSKGEGRGRFSLEALRGSRLNIDSEAKSITQLDHVESLKLAITGNTLLTERKGADARPLRPEAILAFCANAVPMQGSGDAESIASRYILLRFNKRFKPAGLVGPGDLVADPRFAGDPSWLRTKVIPAFANMLLAALAGVIERGDIGLERGRAALVAERDYNSHLTEAMEFLGLRVAPGEAVRVKDLHEGLLRWYRQEGILDDAGKFSAWQADTPHDPYVKHSSFLANRLKRTLYPMLKTDRDRKGTFILGMTMEPLAEYPDTDDAQLIVAAFRRMRARGGPEHVRATLRAVALELEMDLGSLHPGHKD